MDPGVGGVSMARGPTLTPGALTKDPVDCSSLGFFFLLGVPMAMHETLNRLQFSFRSFTSCTH